MPYRQNLVSRRRFVLMTLGVAGVVGIPALAARNTGQRRVPGGRLRARPRTSVTTTARGEVTLDVGSARETILRMPATVGSTPLPLLVAFHGATGSARSIVRELGDVATAAGLVVLATSSRSGTWDAIRGEFGTDVDVLDRALERVFATVDVDPARITVGGFSDGATYALTLGAINGDLFRRVVAFSPGFMIDDERTGSPEFFISHGTSDAILPIDQTSRLLVPGLRGRGYAVTYREFDGGHTVPAAIAREGMAWAARPPRT